MSTPPLFSCERALLALSLCLALWSCKTASSEEVIGNPTPPQNDPYRAAPAPRDPERDAEEMEQDPASLGAQDSRWLQECFQRTQRGASVKQEGVTDLPLLLMATSEAERGKIEVSALPPGKLSDPKRFADCLEAMLAVPDAHRDARAAFTTAHLFGLRDEADERGQLRPTLRPWPRVRGMARRVATDEITRILPQIGQCNDLLRRTQPDAKGALYFIATLDEEGRITTLDMQSTLTSPTFGPCMSKSLKSMSFPPPESSPAQLSEVLVLEPMR